MPDSRKRWGYRYKLPAERKALACEIASSRQLVSQHKQKIAHVSSSKTLELRGRDRAGMTALFNIYFHALAQMHEEERYLAELESQLPGHVKRKSPHRQSLPHEMPHVETQW
jgi:hypothetical protein